MIFSSNSTKNSSLRVSIYKYFHSWPMADSKQIIEFRTPCLTSSTPSIRTSLLTCTARAGEAEAIHLVEADSGEEAMEVAKTSSASTSLSGPKMWTWRVTWDATVPFRITNTFPWTRFTGRRLPWLCRSRRQLPLLPPLLQVKPPPALRSPKIKRSQQLLMDCNTLWSNFVR